MRFHYPITYYINNINFNIPDHVTSADPNFYLPHIIQLLIGADLFWELLNEVLIRLPAGPCLQNTKLGWIISGSIQTQNRHINQISCNFIEHLMVNVEKVWEREVITHCVFKNKMRYLGRLGTEQGLHISVNKNLTCFFDVP